MAMRAAIPSPTAEPSCLVDPARTSPAQKTPGMEVPKAVPHQNRPDYK